LGGNEQFFHLFMNLVIFIFGYPFYTKMATISIFSAKWEIFLNISISIFNTFIINKIHCKYTHFSSPNTRKAIFFDCCLTN
jgi:cytochrome c oxidase assembly factor CtaG